MLWLRRPRLRWHAATKRRSLPVDASLPIEGVLPELSRALGDGRTAVLIAPPGAGKTTAVALRLLQEDWCSGQIFLLSPRRVAARAAAERMADMLGEHVGEHVGYVTRLDSCVGPKTRVIVMTEAIFVSRIIGDPELQGVSAVLFDEAHERNLDSDLGLALAIECREVLRDDLRLVVMSATIEGGGFAALLGDDTALIESMGRAHPLTIKWLGSDPQTRIEDQMARAIARAWTEDEGDILAFLPAVADIDRLYDRIAPRYGAQYVHRLHGQISPAAQRAAIQRDHSGRRIVIASAIAETSLTLDGVRIVVDSGLSRMAEYDPISGASRLVTRRSSQAAATQRAGRAARQAPGVVYRLWEEAGHGGRVPYDPPECETTDLASLMLTLGRWGTRDPNSLRWLTPLPAASIASAREKLVKMNALDADGTITDWGRKISLLPMDPFGASAVLHGARHGQQADAARLVMLLQERGVGGDSEDVLTRLDRLKTARTPRELAAIKMADRWAALASKIQAKTREGGLNPALFLAMANPDNIAKPRSGTGDLWVAGSGRGFALDAASPLCRAQFVVICGAQGAAKQPRILMAAPIDAADILEHFASHITTHRTLRWDSREARLDARLERKLRALVLATGQDPAPDEGRAVDILVDKFVENLDRYLPRSFLARAEFAEIAGFSDANLIANASQWLAPLLRGRRDLNIAPKAIEDALRDLLSWEELQALERVAPRNFISPADTSHPIDYASDDAPVIEIRVQALFGLDVHPMVGRTPLLLKLTSPAGRPIQATRDLPAFWRGSWHDVRKDMKGRYPKHRWPDEPWLEKPSLKTKNAFNRD